MKKLAVALFVALLGLAFTAPAFALENEFGGYFRVRMWKAGNMSGNDADESMDQQMADSRTRLYYTAKISDNLKLVNKFEMDADWGVGGTSYGDVGADGIAVEVKNTYFDYNFGSGNVKMGTMGGVIQRGLLWDDDFSGVVVNSNGFTGLYAKVSEAGDGKTSASDDAQMYHIKYGFGMGDVTLTPNVTYVDLAAGDSLWYLGLDVDGKAGSFGYWGTFIYNGGEIGNDDVGGFLVALGGDVAMSDMVSIHGQIFHATGDDDATDGDIDAFTTYSGGHGQSYYWSEIMGYGIFDDYASNGSCDDSISNITALNIGVKYAATEKLTLSADLWYAMLAEDDANGEDQLGTEVDLNAVYMITDALKLDLVAAYLFAGDATTGKVADDANPYEVGARFSISF